jgi:hypothetical protein
MVTTAKKQFVHRKLDSVFVTPTLKKNNDMGRYSRPTGSRVLPQDLADRTEQVSSNLGSDMVSESVIGSLVAGSEKELNLLLPREQFLSFLSKNFVCKLCSSPIIRENVDVVNIGCACNVYWRCSSHSCGKASMLSKPATTDLSGSFRSKYTDLYTELGDYDINRQIVLACQQSGGGARMASTFGCLMSLSNRSIWNRSFTKVEELIGKAQIVLGEQIMRENLQMEINASPMDETLNRKKITLAMDGGWDQRASGKAYNSASGRHVSVGVRTRKVCHLVYFSKRCAKCEIGKEHESSVCANPEKYAKSSKAMESIGAVKTVHHIWRNYDSAYCSAIITDEDSTTRSKVSHSMQELVETGRMTEAERRYKPKVEGNLGSKKDDHGELPIEHPTIDLLSDPIHYVKSYKSELYNLVTLSKKKSETCKADATRLSRNFAYMIAQHTPGSGLEEDCTFDKFCCAGKASFEHHWNNHQFCGDWCQAKRWNKEQKEELKHKYRDKVRNKKEYEQQKVVHEKFTEITRMWKIFHEWDNNKTESIHGLIVNQYLPKRSYFCRTICGKARTLLAVSIDSLGYYEYYKKLYLVIGITMTEPTASFYREMDKRRLHDRTYTNTPEFRKKRAKRKMEMMKRDWKKEVEDKQQGHTYRSNMAAPSAPHAKKDAPSSSQPDGNKTMGDGAAKKKRVFCNACQNYGHMRRTSKLCTKNPKFVCKPTVDTGMYNDY